MPPPVPLPGRRVLEVERKFRSIPGLVNLLNTNAGNPAFRTLVRQKGRRFEDVYYDYDNKLASKGIWVRTRNNHWQAKLRIGGNFANSQFHEISNPNKIFHLVRQYCPDIVEDSTSYGLLEIARFVTSRATWKADDAFTIVLDETDFGHSVGEVELERVVEQEEAEDQSISKGMDTQIERFMDMYHWAFPKGDTVGKLSAYFEWKMLGSLDRK